MQGVVWHPLYLFCIDEKFGLCPALKWFNFSGLLHFSYGSGVHGTKYCPQADVLNFVQSVGVHPSCSSPGAGSVFQRWLDCSHVDGFLNLGSWHPSVFQTISSGQQAS